MQAKEHIDQQFAKAVEFEVENFHFDAGKPGGEGSIHWSNKQEIVNHWTKPIHHAEKANKKFAD